jgi:hypothetical protein
MAEASARPSRAIRPSAAVAWSRRNREHAGMPEYIPTEDGGRIRIPNELVEASRSDALLTAPHGQEVSIMVVRNNPAPESEPDGAKSEAVANFFMSRDAFEGWVHGAAEMLIQWREMGI